MSRLDHLAGEDGEPEGSATVVGSYGRLGDQIPVGFRTRLVPGTIQAAVLRTGHPVLVKGDRLAQGPYGEWLGGLGLRAGVAAPIVVGGSYWGVAVAVTSQDDFPPGTESRMADFTELPFPPGTADRMADFTDLLATAVWNAQIRAELAASRARIVTAADDTRRRIERDLHDGTQQRLVSLGLELRLTQGMVPAELPELETELGKVADELNEVVEDLREISRGIHPAILSEGGLGPALRTLASLPIRIPVAGPTIANATSETRSGRTSTSRLSEGGAKKNAPARTPSTTPASAGHAPPITATAVTTSSSQNRNPPSPMDDRNGSRASVITAEPTIIRTHARSRRARDRWPDEAPTRPRSTLTTVRVTDEYSQREDEPHPGGTGRRRSSPPEGPASLLHRSENEAPAKRIAASQDPQVRPAGGESMRWHQ